MKVISSIKNIKHRNSRNFFLIAGPCVVEDEPVTRDIAMRLKEITDKHQIPFIFKASYRKANRSRSDSFKGIGDEKALVILGRIKEDINVPILTDIHSPEEAKIAAQFVDILQIPAFLCRQTDLLQAAANTGRIVNIKKGQFLSPESMLHAANKVTETGNLNVMLTERGTTFGYQDLVVDFRGIPIMKAFNFPVVVDITHSLQQPNHPKGITGGRPELIETIGKAAIAVGADGIFIETHPNPQDALSDGANMLQFDSLDDLLKKLVKIRQVITEF